MVKLRMLARFCGPAVTMNMTQTALTDRITCLGLTFSLSDASLECNDEQNGSNHYCYIQCGVECPVHSSTEVILKKYNDTNLPEDTEELDIVA